MFLECNLYSQEMTKTSDTIELTDTLRIQLEANPSTGYDWTWVHSVSHLIDSLQVLYSSNSKFPIGGGIKETWEFIGTRPGNDTIVLHYCRPWLHGTYVKTCINYVTIKRVHSGNTTNPKQETTTLPNRTKTP
jgi:predicted secreted protein